LYKRLNNLTKASEEFLLKKKLISLGSRILHTVIEDISGLYSDFKYLMIFSETIKRDELHAFIENLKEEISLLDKIEK